MVIDIFEKGMADLVQVLSKSADRSENILGSCSKEVLEIYNNAQWDLMSNKFFSVRNGLECLCGPLGVFEKNSEDVTECTDDMKPEEKLPEPEKEPIEPHIGISMIEIARSCNINEVTDAAEESTELGDVANDETMNSVDEIPDDKSAIELDGAEKPGTANKEVAEAILSFWSLNPLKESLKIKPVKCCSKDVQCLVDELAMLARTVNIMRKACEDSLVNNQLFEYLKFVPFIYTGFSDWAVELVNKLSPIVDDLRRSETELEFELQSEATKRIEELEKSLQESKEKIEIQDMDECAKSNKADSELQEPVEESTIPDGKHLLNGVLCSKNVLSLKLKEKRND